MHGALLSEGMHVDALISKIIFVRPSKKLLSGEPRSSREVPLQTPASNRFPYINMKLYLWYVMQ